MESIDDPTSIIGVGALMVDDTEDIDIDALEKELMSELPTAPVAEIDFAEDYEKEIQQIASGGSIALQSSDTTMDDLENLLNSEDKTSKSVEEHDSLSWMPNNIESSLEINSKPNWSGTNPRDTFLNNMTIEERKRKKITSVMQSLGQDTGGDDFNIDEEEEEGEIAKMLEEIEMLRCQLDNEGMSIKKVPEVSSETPIKKIRAVRRMLRLKHDRLRYCDFMEEGILAVAYLLENNFDGTKEWWGKKPDLRGWPETVKVKLRRMRFDTSNFIRGVLKDYQMGSGWRVLLELVPSLFLYSRQRSDRSDDNLANQDRYKDAINEIHNIDRRNEID